MVFALTHKPIGKEAFQQSRQSGSVHGNASQCFSVSARKSTPVFLPEGPFY